MQHVCGPAVTNAEMFRRAAEGDAAALSCAQWYVKMLSRALNQYIYLYCPDIIVLGGGVSKGLGPWLEPLRASLTASVYTGQRTQLALSQLAEDAGILGAAFLFSR